jgi:hypothetical protein
MITSARPAPRALCVCRLASARRISQPSQEFPIAGPHLMCGDRGPQARGCALNYFRLQFRQVSSYTSHVSGLCHWHYGLAPERRGPSCPLGILRAAEGGKSGVGEVAFTTADTGQHYRVRHIIPRPHGHNMGRSWFPMLWNSLSLPRAEYATNFKVVHYPTDDLFESRSSPRTAWWFSCSSKHMRTRPRGSSCPRRSLPTPKSQSSAICFYEEIPER